MDVEPRELMTTADHDTWDEAWLEAGTYQWFAVQVRTGREQYSARHLRARGYEVFLPCYEERRRRTDRIKRVVCALFAGYVFCRIAPAVSAKVITTPGVIRIVGNRTGPAPIHLEEIEAIQRIVDAQRSAEPWPYLQAGDRVRLESGPLAGLEGLVLTVKNSQRLIVSLSLLQRSVAVEIDPDWVSLSPGLCGSGAAALHT